MRKKPNDEASEEYFYLGNTLAGGHPYLFGKSIGEGVHLFACSEYSIREDGSLLINLSHRKYSSPKEKDRKLLEETIKRLSLRSSESQKSN